MFDVITIGSATVDLFMKSEDFHLEKAEKGVLLCQEYGGKLDVQEFFLQSGGAGTNTAVGFARMGFKAAAVVEIGKDLFGQYVHDELHKEGVKTNYVICEEGEQTAISTVLVSGAGGRSILTHRGASSMLEARDIPWNILSQTRWIHLSNVSANTELLFQLFDHVRQYKIGMSWNPGAKELEILADGGIQVEHVPCEMLFLNAQEWQRVQSVQAALRATVPHIIITDGGRGGTIYLQQGYTHEYSAQPATIVQETGAGDAFATGYVAAHLLGKTVQESAQWGVKNATSVISHMGAKTGLLRRRDFPV